MSTSHAATSTTRSTKNKGRRNAESEAFLNDQGDESCEPSSKLKQQVEANRLRAKENRRKNKITTEEMRSKIFALAVKNEQLQSKNQKQQIEIKSLRNNQDWHQSALSTLKSLVDSHFECTICLTTFKSPHGIPECLHQFCYVCIKETTHACGAECPTCIARVTNRSDFTKDELLEDIMNKVHSTLNALECANTAQVDSAKEVIHSGSAGIEESEKDASSAEYSVQDNGSESDKECCQTDRSSNQMALQTKRKASTAESSKSKMQRKGRNDKYDSNDPEPHRAGTRRTSTFEERCDQLLQFKEELGHFNVPLKYPENPSLGSWCSKVRHAYSIIQKGMTPSINLPQTSIERLEEIGFQWQAKDYDEIFEKRCFELEAFKEEFGHCNIPQSIDNPSLGSWCSKVRHSYSIIQKGMQPSIDLPQDRIDRLEEIGFRWQASDYDEKFEEHSFEPVAFKEDFVYYDLPEGYPEMPPLGD